MARNPRSLTDIARRVSRAQRITAARDARTRPSTSKAKKVKVVKALPSRSGMDLEELLAHITPERRANAKRDHVTIVAFRVGGQPAGTKIFSKSLTYLSDKKGGERTRAHKHWVTKHKDDYGKSFKTARLIVNCDCLTGDTRVLTKNGWRTIFELAEPHLLS